MAKTSHPRVRERIHRCRHCRREMVDARAYSESPFCRVCLAERVATARPLKVAWRRRGQYLELIKAR